MTRSINNLPPEFFEGFFDEMQKLASKSQLLQRVGAGAGGATIGALSSQRKPGESNHDYGKRTALRAAGGGLAGLGGLEAVRAGQKAFKKHQFSKTRGDVANKMKGFAGLGNIATAFLGKDTLEGQKVRAAANVMKSGVAETLVRGGKGSLDKALAQAGDAASKNEKMFQGMWKNKKTRDAYKAGMEDITGNITLSTDQKEKKAKELQKRLGLGKKQLTSFSDDLLSAAADGKVKAPKTMEQMSYDQVKKRVGVSDLGAKSKKSRHIFGRGQTTSFEGGVGAAERSLNSAIRKIRESDMLNPAQKDNMAQKAIKNFESKHGVKITTGGRHGRGAGWSGLKAQAQDVGRGVVGRDFEYKINPKKRGSSWIFGNRQKVASQRRYQPRYR